MSSDHCIYTDLLAPCLLFPTISAHSRWLLRTFAFALLGRCALAFRHNSITSNCIFTSTLRDREYSHDRYYVTVGVPLTGLHTSKPAWRHPARRQQPVLANRSNFSCSTTAERFDPARYTRSVASTSDGATMRRSTILRHRLRTAKTAQPHIQQSTEGCCFKRSATDHGCQPPHLRHEHKGEREESEQCAPIDALFTGSSHGTTRVHRVVAAVRSIRHRTNLSPAQIAAGCDSPT